MPVYCQVASLNSPTLWFSCSVNTNMHITCPFMCFNSLVHQNLGMKEATCTFQLMSQMTQTVIHWIEITSINFQGKWIYTAFLFLRLSFSRQQLHMCVCLGLYGAVLPAWQLTSSPGWTGGWQAEIAHSSSHFITRPTEFKGDCQRARWWASSAAWTPARSCTAGAEWPSTASALQRRRCVNGVAEIAWLGFK